ncbi:MAG: hypothetical protein KJZ84_18765 [Bryobacteraceae bacterium]|nr:hypothetical protein [Bryobacteraceae bacterium]
MKRIPPVLMMLLGCAVLLFAQPALPRRGGPTPLPMASPPETVKSAERLRVLRAEVLAQQHAVRQARQAAPSEPGLSPDVRQEQAKLVEVQKAAQAAEREQATAAPAQPVYVDHEQRRHLVGLTERFHQEVKAEAKSAAALALWLLLGAIGCGLASAIFSLLAWNRPAAAASALVVVLGGATKLFPVQQRADYYQTLTSQSYGLLNSLELPYQMTIAQYDDGVARLKILMDYRATQFPSAGDVAGTTQQMLRELTAAVTT